MESLRSKAGSFPFRFSVEKLSPRNTHPERNGKRTNGKNEAGIIQVWTDVAESPVPIMRFPMTRADIIKTGVYEQFTSWKSFPTAT
jgi:hypothetical protein